MFPGLSLFPEGQIIAFALVFLRAIAFVMSWPVFGVNQIPVQVKILLALVLSVLLFPTLKFVNAEQLMVGNQIIFLAARELFIGLFLGYLMRFFFFAVSIAGELIGLSTGLSSAQMFNPLSGVSSNVMEQFQVILASLILLTLNGHHLFLQSWAQSYQLVPISDFGFSAGALTQVPVLVSEVFLLGIRMAAPVVVSVFLANMALGVLGRAVPQLNIFALSLQVTILLGLIVVFIGMPLFVEDMNGLLTLMGQRVKSVLQVL